MSDPYEHYPDNDAQMRAMIQKGLGFDNGDNSAAAEAPYGPADVIKTGQINLAPTVGGTALIDGDTEL